MTGPVYSGTGGPLCSGIGGRFAPESAQDLAFESAEAHLRWECREEPPIRNTRKNVPKGVSRGSLPAPIKHKPILYRARKKSVRCRFMLFDYLKTDKGKKWSFFNSLYRSLIIIDLNRRGLGDYAIAKALNDNLALVDAAEIRLRSYWEKLSLFRMEGEMEYFSKVVSDSLFLRKRTGHKRDLGESEVINGARLDVRRYRERGEIFVALTEKGQFSRFVEILSAD